MKKMFVLVLVVLMAMFSVAFADGPVNENRQTAMNLPSLMQSKAAGMNAAVTVTGNMECGSALNLHVDVAGGVAPYKFDYYIMTEDEYFDGITNIYFRSTSADETMTLVLPGYYYVLVQVIDAVGNTTCGYNFDVDLPATPAYPSLQTVVNKLAAQCMASCSTEYERALWAHDYIINHADYDTATRFYGADGVLIRGTGSCDSYRLAMEMLLKAMGIKCGSVLAPNHAWNIAEVEGEWYMIDATWDDPTGGSERHSYFCVTTEMIRRDHTIIGYDSYSSNCTSLNCNYAVRTGLTERWMTEDAVTNKPLVMQVEAALMNGETEFSLSTPMLYAAGLTGNSFVSSAAAWQLAWPATAWAMNEKTWQVGDASYELNVSCNIAAKTMTAVVTNVSGIENTEETEETETTENCEHETVTCTDNGSGAHTVLCADCSEELSTNVHMASCANAGICTECGVATAYTAHSFNADNQCEICGFTMSQMKLPGMLKEIEEEAFEGTFAYSVVVPSGCTSIASRAFADSNTHLFVMPASLTEIADDAFDGCTGVMFQAEADSYAAEYAAAHGILCI